MMGRSKITAGPPSANTIARLKESAEVVASEAVDFGAVVDNSIALEVIAAGAYFTGVRHTVAVGILIVIAAGADVDVVTNAVAVFII